MGAGMVEIGVIVFILAIVVIQHWMIWSGRYEKARLTLKNRFLWAIICAVIPAIVFIEKPNIYSAIATCFVFFYVLLFGSNYKKISEKSDATDERN
jgi:Ca2+/Na+ antiporter